LSQLRAVLSPREQPTGAPSHGEGETCLHRLRPFDRDRLLFLAAGLLGLWPVADLDVKGAGADFLARSSPSTGLGRQITHRPSGSSRSPTWPRSRRRVDHPDQVGRPRRCARWAAERDRRAEHWGPERISPSPNAGGSERIALRSACARIARSAIRPQARTASKELSSGQ